MERTNKADELIRYKKIGGGSLRMGGKIIKPNQVFTARPMDIPKAFSDVIIPLDKLPEEEEPIEPVKEEFTLEAREYGGYFDVINSAGVKMNEKALRRQAALDLITELKGK